MNFTAIILLGLLSGCLAQPLLDDVVSTVKNVAGGVGSDTSPEESDSDGPEGGSLDLEALLQPGVLDQILKLVSELLGGGALGTVSGLTDKVPDLPVVGDVKSKLPL